MSDRGPYFREIVAIATMHGKERAVAKPFSRWLGTAVMVAPGIDTDSFGTFTGDIPRHGTMLDAARAKARAAIDRTELHLGIGSEGSFGPHPFVPFVAAGTEALLFIDRRRGIEIYETLVSHRTNYRSRACRPGERIDDFLRSVGFPAHAVVVSSNNPVTEGQFEKGIGSFEQLTNAIVKAASASDDGLALVVTDMRAHMNPTRMAVIRMLSTRLARRLATACPTCEAPGFGMVELVRGLPCAWCGEPTRLALAEVWRCAKCGFESRARPRKGPDTADPGQCEHCNP